MSASRLSDDDRSRGGSQRDCHGFAPRTRQSTRDDGIDRLCCQRASSGFMIHFMMKYSSIVAIILSSAIFSTGCSPSKSAHAAKPEMTRCQGELNTIPEVAAASIKTRNKRPDD